MKIKPFGLKGKTNVKNSTTPGLKRNAVLFFSAFPFKTGG
jgi:hypothetical protein